MEIQIASDLHLEMYAAQQPAPGGYRSATDARGRPCAPEGGPVYPPIQAFTQVPGLDLAGDVGTGDLAREYVERELDAPPILYVPGNHEYKAQVRVGRAAMEGRDRLGGGVLPGVGGKSSDVV